MRISKTSSDSTMKGYTKKNQENLDEMDNFLDRYQVPKLNQDQINGLKVPFPLKK